MYYTEGAGINLYARPIEGLQAIIDLDERRIVKLLDTGVVPIPAANHNFDEASVGASVGLRPELRPIRISQPLGPNFTHRRQLHRMAEVALPRALREARRAGDLARHLRPAPGDVPGLARRDLRALPGPGRRTGSTAPTWMPASSASACSPRRSPWGSTCPENAVLLDALGGRGDSGSERAGRAAAAAAGDRRVRAPDRQSGLAPLRAVRRRPLRRPRRGRAGRAQHRPGRQLRLPARLDLHAERRHPRRGRPDRHRCAQGGRHGGGAARRQRPALRRPGGGRAGRAVPQPSLQLPPRPRHRRPEQQLRAGRAEAAAGAGPAQEHLDRRPNG